MEETERKILVAVDGSIYSANSVDYLSRMFTRDSGLSVHLLAVVSTAGSDQNWMFDVDPLRGESGLTEGKRRSADRALRDASERLIRNGWDEKRITREVLISRASIPTAIHHAAIHGRYDALLVGRRGIGKVGEMFFGSVSSWLVGNCHELPLWIIDGEVKAHRFLLAVHCLPQSLMAADHLAFMMQADEECEICLYHSLSLFGSCTPPPLEEFHRQWGRKWCEKHLDLDNHLFEAHARILIEGGVAPERIHRLAPGKDLYVSHDLIRRATRHDCGTIVIGRRGREADKGILGGVSDRTLLMAQDLAVWLVG